MKKIIQIAAILAIFIASASAAAFQVTGDSFPAEFNVTSMQSSETGSILTAEGDIDGYGRVYLTYNLKSAHGLGDLGHFSGQIRSVTKEGVMFGTLNGVYRVKEGKLHVHTFDTHSNGDIVMAIGTIDAIEGKGTFTVYPVD